MKVLQVLPTLSAGGAEGFVTNLGVSLALLDVNVSFLLLAGVRGKRGNVLLKRLRNAGIEVIGHEEHNVRSPVNIINLLNIFYKWKPDIVQANLYSAEIAVAVSKFFILKNNIVFFRRLANTEQVGSRSLFLVRKMDKIFSHTVACSPAVATSYVKFAGDKKQTELFTIPNGGFLFDHIPTQYERMEARKLLGISSNAFVVSHIGRMFAGRGEGDGLSTDQKAHDVLITAFAESFQGQFDRTLLLVGDGSLRADLEQLAVSLGVAEQIIFLGRQPEPWPALLASDMFFFPSRYEGLPNVLPEAASCGLPVLASDIPEIRDIQPDNEPWILEDVDDIQGFSMALSNMAQNIENHKVKAIEAVPFVKKKFSMEKCALKYLDVYNDALSKQRFIKLK
jgi:glycosyltransferase involved in cell wall biosynthesis